MRIFLTGATGFIGSAIVPELIHAGHQVLGLTRSEAGAQSLIAAGAEVHRGNLDDLESLRSGAAKADGVIHTAFNHDFSKFVANCEIGPWCHRGDWLRARRLRPPLDHHVRDRDGEHCARSTRDGRKLKLPTRPSIPAQLRKKRPLPLAARGVNVSVVRLPQVHDTVKQGLITYAIEVARDKGVSAYVGDGLNRWPAVHVLDTARLYRLALEKREAGSRYHAVAEEGVPIRDIAEVIGRGLKIPVVSMSPEEAPAISAGSPPSSVATFPLQARKRRNGWDGARRALV